MHPDQSPADPSGPVCGPDTDRRFGGLSRLYGASGAKRISHAHVVVVGIGGVGSWTVEAFARSGVGRLTLVDLDHVAESNINRQVHALDSTLGMAKVLAMRERIAQINPACQVEVREEFAEEGNLDSLLPGDANALVDACDQVRAKVALAQWARARGIGFVTVGAAGGKQLAHRVEVEDLGRVTHDPLLAQMRYRLRRVGGYLAKPGKAMGVMTVFSREQVQNPAAVGKPLDHSLNCHGYGSSVAVTGTFGLCAAGWILEQLAAGASFAEKSRLQSKALSGNTSLVDRPVGR